MSHLRYVKAACQKALPLLRVLAYTSWGADTGTTLLLHRMLILSKLEYGCEVYSHTTEARLPVLASVHLDGVCLAIRAFRSSPILNLLVDPCVLHVKFRRQTSLM